MPLQYSPRSRMVPMIFEDRSAVPISTPRHQIGRAMFENKHIQTPSRPRGRMTTVIVENRDKQPQLTPRGQVPIPIANYTNEVPNLASILPTWSRLMLQISSRQEHVKGPSFMSSSQREFLRVHDMVSNAVLTAERNFSTIMYPNYTPGVSPPSQEFLFLLSLDLMFSLYIPNDALRPKSIIWNCMEKRQMNPKEIVEIFWMTGLPRTERPRLGVAVCFIEGDAQSKHFVSDHTLDVHAESTMIDYLKRVLISERLKCIIRSGSVLHIEVFQNYSPCGECSKKYCRLLGDFANLGICVKIKIHFVSMYKIYWEIANPQQTLDWLPSEVHRRNRDGMVRMMEGGFEMHTFTVHTWMTLLNRMGLHVGPDVIQHYIACGRNDVDCKTAETFNKLIQYASSQSQRFITHMGLKSLPQR